MVLPRVILAPHGFASLTPYFTVDDPAVMIGFLRAVFDAEVILDNRHEDGSVQHIRFRLGDSLMMMTRSGDGAPALTLQTHLYVDAVEACLADALAHGAGEIMAPNLRPHGDWMAGFTDPCGNIWWVAAQQAG
jgi:uncharacterized glyoxalase superfamily protein PhnB